MRKGEATKARILEEAALQAAIRGLTAVSLADVAEPIGLSKSGLFKHFESKDALHEGVIELVMNRFIEVVWRPAEAEPAGEARLKAVFDHWLDWSEERWADSGCPIMALSVELDDQPGPLHDLLQKRLQNWRKTLIREFRMLGDPPLSEAEAQAAYFQMKSFILGHSDARRMLGDKDARRSAQAAFDALIERTLRRPT